MTKEIENTHKEIIMKSKRYHQNTTALQKLKTDPFTIYRKVLVKTLVSNCQGYDWYQPLIGFIRARDWKAVYSWADRVDAAASTTTAECFAVGQIVALIKKYPWDPKTIGLQDPKEVAIDTFLEAEKRCKKTNRRFSSNRYLRSRYAKYIAYMRAWISSVLGENPDLTEIYKLCDFSSGSAIGCTGNATNLYRKFSAKDWTCTPTALLYAKHAMWSNPHYSLLLFPNKEELTFSNMEDVDKSLVCFDVKAAKQDTLSRVVYRNSNKVDFVPKTAKTHRSIAVEPLLNAFLQKGVDSYMRHKLRRHGYDLTNQERNGHYAKLGSIDGSYSTLDLSSASDTISLKLCKTILPSAWFSFLNQVRSPAYELEGNVSSYHKFVSMGNGFCFPLETLIFASAVRAAIHFSEVSDRMHCVYGDDIIVPRGCEVLLQNLLKFLGFVPNKDKSFLEGPFRESCGADWYQGQDVRPVYLKDKLDSLSKLIVFHNVTRRSKRTEFFFTEVRKYLRSLCSPKQTFMRPLYAAQNIPRFDINGKPISWFDIISGQGAFDVEMEDFMRGHYSYWSRSLQRWRWKELAFRLVTDRSEGHRYRYMRYVSLLRGSPRGEIALRRKTKVSVKLK